MNPLANLVVQKFGGATLATPELIRKAAERLLAQSRKGPLIAVVSAMGSTTDSLIALAKQVSHHPPRRELDMLLSVGERTSMALVSMALQDLGASAISLTGSQAGILTDESHFHARILEVKPIRVEEALREGKIVILAGFQGVSPKTKEITTLGRGGSDLTAVAMAAALGAKRCEILKDVAAVFSADPKIVPAARPLTKLNYDQLSEMTYWGAKVLHHRSVDLARLRNVPIYVGPAADANAGGTMIQASNQIEKFQLLSVNSHENVLRIQFGSGDGLGRWLKFLEELNLLEINQPQLLNWSQRDQNIAYVTSQKETLEAIRQLLHNSRESEITTQKFSSVSMTFSSMPTDQAWSETINALRRQKVEPLEIFPSPLSITLLIKQNELNHTIAVAHDLFAQFQP